MKNEIKKFNKAYESDASQLKGKTEEVIFPENIEEVKKTVLNLKRIVPRGGGTGLAGGAVPQGNGDFILDLSKLNKIENLDKERMTIEVEAGVILDELQDYLEEYNLEFPINPSSHSICTIGGMIATDAVGSRAIKYKKTSQWTKWLDIIDCYGNLSRKGITELSDYIGMEGITGIIVRASLKLSPKKIRTATVIGSDSIEDISEKTRILKKNPTISMIEFVDKKISKGIGLNEKYHLIIEFESNTGELKNEEYSKILETRDKIYPFLSNQGYNRIEDPKVSLESFEGLFPWLEKQDIPVFGHLSVGIIHPCFNTQQEKLIPRMMEIVKRKGGKISGEHGIGILKKSFVEPNDKKILANIKKRTDPLNKFNVNKVI
ncbi:MAG: FAD-binding oxidoreductase [Candidatus Pacearchaeota archaeon]